MLRAFGEATTRRNKLNIIFQDKDSKLVFNRNKLKTGGRQIRNSGAAEEKQQSRYYAEPSHIILNIDFQSLYHYHEACLWKI